MVHWTDACKIARIKDEPMSFRDTTNQTKTRSCSLDGSVVTVSSIPSIPSIEVSSSPPPEEVEWGHNNIPSEVHLSDEEEEEDAENFDETTPGETVSVDKERQVLLLFLLAQVCALHDPTPRTFT